MPDRPKRRKNKNKRKNNKNNRSDVNQNNIGENETPANESCSDVSENFNENAVEKIQEEIKDEGKCDTKEGPTSLEIISEPIKLEKTTNEIEINNEINKTDECNVTSTYIVETPEQGHKTKPKLDNAFKSKSCDNDDSPTITEITDDVSSNSDNRDNVPIIESNNVVITEDESHIEWENVDDFKSPQTELIEGVLSSTTIPLNIAHCEQTKTLSPEEESSLRNYLQTLDLSTNSINLNVGDIKTEIEQIINREVKYRLRRKGFAEDIICPRPGPSRSLAVIDEESGESSKTSRRQSYLSDRKSDNEELEDEVFESKQTTIESNESNSINYANSKHLIPQKCIRVDAKLKEPEISEARGDWTMQTVEKMTGAELVYLTDSSSSTSSIYEANEDISPSEDDVSVRMITPTIEITDTETLLSNTFLAKHDNKDKDMNQKDILNNEKENNNDKSTNDFITNGNQNSDESSNQQSHEIVILSTDNLKTDLFVKELEEETFENIYGNENYMKENDKIKPSTKSSNEIDQYDLEIKVLKCELNDAINNLIKEVTSDSENNEDCIKNSIKRQDSSSSVDSSQCTAKYNPTHSSLSDVSNLILESDSKNKENIDLDSGDSHVKDVLQCINTDSTLINKNISKIDKNPFTLRDTCLKKIATFPFGDKILEELANVSHRLQNSILASQCKRVEEHDIKASKVDAKTTLKENNQTPPPINPRKSSLKKSQDESFKSALPSRSEIVYECLSPSQKMLMEKTNTIIAKEDLNQKVDAFFGKLECKNTNQNRLDIAPMKSETGSRLLAFLRDTSNTSKSNLKIDSSLKTEKQLQKNKVTQSNAKRMIDEIDAAEIPFYNTSCRPISSLNSKFLPRLNNEPLYFYESDSGIRESSFSTPYKRNNITSYSYESDSGMKESSFHSLSNHKKYFHYSTGNLSKEIESDISSIQNMHRHCTDLRNRKNEEFVPRRPSLPKDLCEQQMEYIRQKEKEVDAEIRRLEMEKNREIHKRGPRAPMVSDSEIEDNRIFDLPKRNLAKRSYAPIYPSSMNVERRKISSLFSSSEEELLREKMYSEYVNQMAEREQRKQHKVIKVTQTPVHSNTTSRSMPALESNSRMNNRIEQEFISKAKERWSKLGIRDSETEDEREYSNNIYREPKVIEHKIKVIESGEEKDVKKLPSHMQEFVKFTVSDNDDENGSTGESDKTSAHVVVFCAVVILVLTVGKFLLRLFRNK